MPDDEFSRSRYGRTLRLAQDRLRAAQEAAMIDERRLHLDNESDQRAVRTARGLRALAAALMVAGLVAAIVTELPFSRSSVAAMPASEEIANPLPATDPTGVPIPGDRDDFQDRTPTPPSVIVG